MRNFDLFSCVLAFKKWHKSRFKPRKDLNDNYDLVWKTKLKCDATTALMNTLFVFRRVPLSKFTALVKILHATTHLQGHIFSWNNYKIRVRSQISIWNTSASRITHIVNQITSVGETVTLGGTCQNRDWTTLLPDPNKPIFLAVLEFWIIKN